MDRFSARLAQGDVLVLDGGMGTTVEDRGADVQAALWGSMSLLTPAGRALNDDVHRDFRTAGAELLLTNTHDASEWQAGRYLAACGLDGLESELRAELLALDPAARPRRLCDQVNAQAVASLRRACPGDGVLLGGCVSSPKSPWAAESPPEEVIVGRLRSHVEVLMAHELDVIVFELFTTREDLRAATRIALELGLERMAIAVSCDRGGRTVGGVSMSEVVALTAAARPAAYFVQCTPYDQVLPALDELVAAAEGTAVGVYANDCRVWRDRRWHGPRVEPEVYSGAAREWIRRGARLVGGCCGTGPEHVEALARIQ